MSQVVAHLRPHGRQPSSPLTEGTAAIDGNGRRSPRLPTTTPRPDTQGGSPSGAVWVAASACSQTAGRKRQPEAPARACRGRWSGSGSTPNGALLARGLALPEDMLVMKFGMERRGRLRAGLTRARDEGTQKIPSKAEAAVRAALAAGKGICATAKADGM